MTVIEIERRHVTARQPSVEMVSLKTSWDAMAEEITQRVSAGAPHELEVLGWVAVKRHADTLRRLADK